MCVNLVTSHCFRFNLTSLTPHNWGLALLSFSPQIHEVTRYQIVSKEQRKNYIESDCDHDESKDMEEYSSFVISKTMTPGNRKCRRKQQRRRHILRPKKTCDAETDSDNLDPLAWDKDQETFEEKRSFKQLVLTVDQYASSLEGLIYDYLAEQISIGNNL